MLHLQADASPPALPASDPASTPLATWRALLVVREGRNLRALMLVRPCSVAPQGPPCRELLSDPFS